MPVVPTGRNRFVYTSWRKKHVQRLWSYNLGHARFHALPIKDAYPELNLGNHTLLCTQISVSTHPYFLYFMRGETASMRTLPLESWYTAVKYIQGLHTLLVGRASSSLFVSAIHRWTLYQYDLQSGAMKPLTGKTEVGLDSVVWLRHRP